MNTTSGSILCCQLYSVLISVTYLVTSCELFLFCLPANITLWRHNEFINYTSRIWLKIIWLLFKLIEFCHFFYTYKNNRRGICEWNFTTMLPVINLPEATFIQLGAFKPIFEFIYLYIIIIIYDIVTNYG